MANTNQQLRITELDYDQILANLVAFMKAEPAFADYDFSGSGLRMIARVLAYVTFYNAHYLSAAVNESFLDTAQLRSSVASHARMLGYQIRGTQSASTFANVSVTLDNTNSAAITLPKLTAFSLIANSQYAFYSTEDATLTLNTTTGTYDGANIPLVEGRPLEYRFTVDTTNPSQRFVIPNANVDFNTIEVRVQDSISSNSSTVFQQAPNYLTISATDPVFFVQENENGFAELIFGNDAVGRALAHNNIIIVNYFISRGLAGNNLTGPFRISANIEGFVDGITIYDAPATATSGGANQESMESARFLAPLAYAAQNRCVTTDDYKAMILREYGEHVAAINVFGGEQGDPTDPSERPVFGRVFIAMKPKIGLFFTDVIRTYIEQRIIKPHSVVGVIPQVIDPDYTYININTLAKYDPRATTRTKSQLQELITTAVTDYVATNIEKFDAQFRYSRFVRVIDDADDAITSSLTRLDLEKRIFPVVGASNEFVLKFNVPIRQITPTSVFLESGTHRFTHRKENGELQTNCFFATNGNTVTIVYRDGLNNIQTAKTNAGSVNRDTGLITITGFQPEAIENDAIDVRIRLVPAVTDFTPRLNQLFTVDPENILVRMVDESTATRNDQLNFFSGILP